MAGCIGMNAYLIRMRKAHTRGWATLKRNGTIDGYALAHEYFKKHLDDFIVLSARPGELKRGLKIIRFEHNDKESKIWGLAEAGEFGRSQSIVDTHSKKVTYSQKPGEAGVSPFYFFLYFPEEKPMGILLAQRNGHLGLKASLLRSMKEHFGKQEITLNFPVLMQKDILEKYLVMGDLKEIRVITHTTQKTSQQLLRDTMVAGEHMAPGTRVELILRRAKGFDKGMDTIRSIMKTRVDDNGGATKKKAVELVEVHGLTDPEDVVVSVGNKEATKKFSIYRPEDTGVSYNLDGLETDANGHPQFSAIHKRAGEICAELEQSLI